MDPIHVGPPDFFFDHAARGSDPSENYEKYVIFNTNVVFWPLFNRYSNVSKFSGIESGSWRGPHLPKLCMVFSGNSSMFAKPAY